MVEVVFSSKAYCKVILHSAKYPHCAINGVLLAANDKSDSLRKITYTDAIPLFHMSLQLAPMAEIALTQGIWMPCVVIELWAESVNLVIAGYYFANENLTDSNMDRSSHKIADKLADIFPHPCIAAIDNECVTVDHKVSALKLSQLVDKKWKPLEPSNTVVSKNTLKKTSLLLRHKICDKLIDFDNHLDNISLDWRNNYLNDAIEDDAT